MDRDAVILWPIKPCTFKILFWLSSNQTVLLKNLILQVYYIIISNNNKFSLKTKLHDY